MKQMLLVVAVLLKSIPKADMDPPPFPKQVKESL